MRQLEVPPIVTGEHEIEIVVETNVIDSLKLPEAAALLESPKYSPVILV